MGGLVQKDAWKMTRYCASMNESHTCHGHRFTLLLPGENVPKQVWVKAQRADSDNHVNIVAIKILSSLYETWDGKEKTVMAVALSGFKFMKCC